MSYAFVLSMLAVVAGCGENVLVGNWQLRSLSDAGVDVPEEVDAAPNVKADRAQAARAAKQKQKLEQKEDREGHTNGSDKTSSGH